MSVEINPRLEFIKNFVEAQKEFKPVQKTSKNAFLKSRYATYEDVHPSVVPSLNKHGFMVSHGTKFVDGVFVLVTTISHIKGHEISSAHVIEKTVTMQDKGSGETYAKRYNLVALTAVPVIEEDDDGENEKYQIYKNEAIKLLNNASDLIYDKFQSFIGKDKTIDSIEATRYQAICEWIKKEIAKESSNVVSK